jgi:class 3 adenylate cyclase
MTVSNLEPGVSEPRLQERLDRLRANYANHGALVKTIGDAVMASFHEPLDAIRAALGMRAQIRRFHDSAREELITLKMARTSVNAWP